MRAKKHAKIARYNGHLGGDNNGITTPVKILPRLAIVHEHEINWYYTTVREKKQYQMKIITKK